MAANFDKKEIKEISEMRDQIVEFVKLAEKANVNGVSRKSLGHMLGFGLEEGAAADNALNKVYGRFQRFLHPDKFALFSPLYINNSNEVKANLSTKQVALSKSITSMKDFRRWKIPNEENTQVPLKLIAEQKACEAWRAAYLILVPEAAQAAAPTKHGGGRKKQAQAAAPETYEERVRRVISEQNSEELEKIFIDFDSKNELISTLPDELKNNLLIFAAKLGFVNVVQHLFNKSSFYYPNPQALVSAAENGHSDVVSFFLDKGISLLGLRERPRTVRFMLGKIIELKKFDIIKMFLDKKCSTFQDNLLSLMDEAIIARNDGLLEALFEMNKSDKNKELFFLAIERGSVEIVNALINKGANVNFIDKNGKTPLMIAVEEQRFDLVVALIDKNADVNFIDKNGETPLMIAIKTGRVNLVKTLLLFGATVDLNHLENVEDPVMKMLLKWGSLTSMKNQLESGSVVGEEKLKSLSNVVVGSVKVVSENRGKSVKVNAGNIISEVWRLEAALGKGPEDVALGKMLHELEKDISVIYQDEKVKSQKSKKNPPSARTCESKALNEIKVEKEKFFPKKEPRIKSFFLKLRRAKKEKNSSGNPSNGPNRKRP